MRVEGGLAEEFVREIFRRHRSEVSYCVRQAQPNAPPPSGRVTIQLTVDLHGGVEKVHMTFSTLNDTAAELCILSRIRTWRFPRPAGEGTVTVRYPLLFKVTP